MYFVYLLKLSNNSIYTGSTPNIKIRIREHQRGDVNQLRIFVQ
ncbi:hypothetical protein COV53_04355 [Candidatus Gottesmanbacteria bacterium CG11_big_fil_rev_8_21_14_0_20_37_11]|uniref:GIY-YIG domain-containing protein n=2 Tax=Candidatus Gottesmaniibacteriota TaxID=1752720 RepID=A0A2M7RS26_9BACT|nr:MAG: hypothetical protein COV53_04355 [Candidatus Gottesmanbacteria bacterium CG11_big_fil_rev_8_21_14_0_20_37_11]PIZ03121.1 MAG: hypothetical protein COY59_01275 [Candidatus Gottesmanbacteria bacterium CG_4_10_14_0_8_um_filter_37_24]